MLSDLRRAWRYLVHSPKFSLVAILSLALGIAASSVIFSFVYTVVLAPLPFPQPDRLIAIQETVRGRREGGSPQRYRDWLQAPSIAHVTAFYLENFSVQLSETPEHIGGYRTFGDFLETLNVQPALGRAFSDSEKKGNGARVAVITDSLWKHRFSSDPGVVGRQIRLNGESCQIIGVLPRAAKLEDADIIAPEPLQNLPRAARFLTQWGRLKSGALPETAQQEASVVAGRLRTQYPATDAELGVEILNPASELAGTFSTRLLILLGAVTLVLLMACLNVASLSVSRIASRRRELSICRALGASRFDVIRLVLIEALLLAIAGGALGLLAAGWGIDFLAALAPQLPRVEEVHMNPYVVAFAALCTLLASAISGLIPALRFSGEDLNPGLKNGARGSSSQHHLQDVLVAGQMALSLALLVAGGLLFRSLWNIEHRSLGFEPGRLTSFQFSLPWQTPDAEANHVYERVIERLRSVPGVEDAALTDRLPLGGDTQDGEVQIPGGNAASVPPGSTINQRSVSTNYHQLMRVPLLSGRYLEPTDTKLKRAVINRAAAEAYFRHGNPIGQHIGIRWSNDSGPLKNQFEIVGVVGNTPSRSRELRAEPAFYIPFQQGFWPLASFVVRTSGPPATVAGSLRRAVAEIDSTHALDLVQTVDSFLASRSQTDRLQAGLVDAFSLAALLLAGVGVYGLAARRLTAKQNEIAIRIALGAQPGSVTREMLIAILRPAAAGAALGLLFAAALARSLQTSLFGVSTFDPGTYAAAGLALLVLVVLAAWPVARRAASVDPMRLLREM